MRRASARVARLLAALALGAALAGCGTAGYQQAGPWKPLPQGNPPEVGPPTGSAPVPAPGQPADPGSGQTAAGDPNVVATDLNVPTGLVVLPDGTAVVGERETGRLVHVFPDRSPAQELMTVPGVDTAGDGGLLGLALSPTYPEDGLLYAYVSTATDNRVVRFPLGGTPNQVLTGIPRGDTHNGGGLAFAADGTLFVGTGDTGDPALAADPASLAGKVLHIDVFGRPVGAGPVYARGFADVPALCFSGDQSLYATDDSAAGDDELDEVRPGADYGWPTTRAAGVDPVIELPGPDAGLAGCTVAGSTVFLGALEGRRIVIVALDANGAPTGDPKNFLVDTYGRLRTVVLDAQGGLWVTTSNRDGAGTPGRGDDKVRRGDDKVLRIVPPTSGGSSPL